MASAATAMMIAGFVPMNMVRCRKSTSEIRKLSNKCKVRRRQSRNANSEKLKRSRECKEEEEEQKRAWTCVSGCGACCKLDKGPLFDPPEDIFDNPEDVDLYRSLIGPDGWCIHYLKDTRTCSIYSERPYFCQARPHVFDKLYGIHPNNFVEEACRACRETIKSVYGTKAPELQRFNRTIKSL